jgi:hypothetical protein
VTARFRRADGREYEVATTEVVIPASLPPVRITLPRIANGLGLSLTRPLGVAPEARARPAALRLLSTCAGRSNWSCPR